jgi:nucleotide-binding universal stress UspA family protein
MKTILLATDGSPSARLATAEAVELAATTGRPLVVVTAWSVPTSAFAYAPLAFTPEIIDAERECGEKALATAVDAAAEAGLEPRTILREGDAGDVICKVANELGAGLIVVGSHGWNPFRRLILGSVSTRVLHHGPCPVLIVRGDRAAATPERVRAKEAALIAR